MCRGHSSQLFKKIINGQRKYNGVVIHFIWNVYENKHFVCNCTAVDIAIN